jgi:hypothetical protein
MKVIRCTIGFYLGGLSILATLVVLAVQFEGKAELYEVE